jgi:hypothetical protein
LQSNSTANQQHGVIFFPLVVGDQQHSVFFFPLIAGDQQHSVSSFPTVSGEKKHCTIVLLFRLQFLNRIKQKYILN